MQVTPRELRKPFTLIVDEAGQQATSLDVADAMEVSRKYGLGWVLAGINLQSFRRKDFDMVPALLSLCNTVVCFRQKWPEDTEVLARVLFGGNLDFTPLQAAFGHHFGHHFPQATDFRVLAICPNAGWRDMLVQEMRQKPGAELWLFCAIQDVTVEKFLHEPIFFKLQANPAAAKPDEKLAVRGPLPLIPRPPAVTPDAGGSAV